MTRYGTDHMRGAGAPLLVACILLAATSGLHREALQAYGWAWRLGIGVEVGLLLSAALLLAGALVLPVRRGGGDGWFLKGAAATAALALAASLGLGVAALAA